MLVVETYQRTLAGISEHVHLIVGSVVTLQVGAVEGVAWHSTSKRHSPRQFKDVNEAPEGEWDESP
jgi:hypothetical protein